MKRSSTCSEQTEWGRCQQETVNELCSFHSHWRTHGGKPDPYYHRKIVLGLTQPTFDYLSDTEVHATLYGRQRQDGRRIDAYVLDDALTWEADRAA